MGAGAMERICESIGTIAIRSYYTLIGIHGSNQTMKRKLDVICTQ